MANKVSEKPPKFKCAKIQRSGKNLGSDAHGEGSKIRMVGVLEYAS